MLYTNCQSGRTAAIARNVSFAQITYLTFKNVRAIFSMFLKFS